MVAGVGAVLAMPKSNSTIKADAATPVTGTTYTLVNSTDNLVVGANYALVSNYNSIYCAASSALNFSNRLVIVINVGNNSFSSNANVLNLELGGESGAWTLKTTNNAKEAGQGYLASGPNSSDNSYLFVENHESTSPDIPTCTINFIGDIANIVVEPHETVNVIKFNHYLYENRGAFSCYKSGEYLDVYLYKASKTAKEWADDFMSKTATACADPSLDNRKAVEAVWLETETFYNSLDETNKALVKAATYEHEHLGEAVKRYDTIIKKIR